MAISFGAIGTRYAPATAVATVPVAYPAGITAGDMLLLFVTAKTNTLTATTPAGWTALLDISGGTGVSGADTGPTRTYVFWQQALGTESGTVSVTLSATPNSACGVIVRYTKSVSNTWATPTAVGGANTTHATAWSVTGAANLSFTTGDLAIVYNGNDTDTTTAYTSPTLTAAGATIGTPVSRLAQGGATAGNDSGNNLYDAAVTAGASTAAPTHTLAGGPSACGETAFIRLREVVSASSVTLTPTSATVSAPAMSPVGASSSYESVHVSSDTPVGTSFFDSQSIVNGVTYFFTQSGTVAGIMWYVPSQVDAAATYEVALYELTSNTAGTALATAQVSGATLTPNSWTSTFFSSPVAVTTGKYYRTARLSPNGYYVATADVFITNKTSAAGNVTAVQDGTNPLGPFVVDNSTYRYSSVLDVPNNNFGRPDYFVDVLFTPGGGGGGPSSVTLTPAIVTLTAPAVTPPSGGGGSGGLLNKTTGATTRNGTTTSTITFPAAQTGSLLVAVVGASATITWPGGPTGWAEQLQPVNFTELSVATRTASGGETSVTITHNAANYPANYVIYEFATGSTWVGTGVSATNTGTWPTLTGLPGTNVRVYGAYNRSLTNAITSVTATWTVPWTEDFTINTPFSTTDGVATSVGYLDTTATSATPTATFSQANSERVVFAINIVSVVPPSGPTVTAGIARPALRGGSVPLDVTAIPPSGESITSHAWVIQSGGGTLTNANTATPTYTAPATGSGLAVIRDTVTASGGGTATADVTVSYHANIVAAENALPGTTRGTWDLSAPNWAGVNTLQGFADGFSADKTETINFKIAQSDTAGWTADIYRLGYYNGNGARFYGTLTPSAGQLTSSQSQPAPGDVDPVTTKLSADCSNWATTLTWTPPSWIPSGMYLLKLNRTGSGASHVMFVIRDDSRNADVMLMPSDSTWNAYNAFGGMGANLLTGNSLYYGTAINQYDNDAARFVSYNRPFVNRAAVSGGYGAVQWSTFFTSEYSMLRFLERNGFDVKYYSCLDAAGDATGAKLTKVKTAIAVGHNEYWSDGMRAGWEAAKANGTSLFFSAGNEVFWRAVGTNNDTSSRPRTWECYKSTIGTRNSLTRPQWTGTWRDPDGVGKGGNAPENALTGTIFMVNGPDLRSLVVPFNGGYSAQPLWRHTTVAALTSGQSWTSPAQILGFEWDTYGPAGVNTTGAAFLAAPHTRARYCSDVTYTVSNLVLTDAGDEYASGNVTHRLVVHPGGNGAIVFGTGTVNWAFGVDSANTYQQGSDNTSVVLQQATVNMLVDMGALPITLMIGLTQPTPQVWFPESVSVTLTPASLTISATAVAAVPGASSATLTPAQATITAPALGPAAGAVSRTLTPAIITTTAVANTAVPGPTGVTLTSATLTYTATALNPVGGSVSITLAPASLTVTALPVATGLGPTEITLTPAVMSTSANPLTASLGAVSLTLTPAAMSMSAPSVTATAGVVEINLVPAQATITVGSVFAALVLPGEATLTPAEIRLLPITPIVYIETPGVDRMTIAFTTVTGVGEYIRGQLVETEGGVPQRFAHVVVPGQIAWDNCDCGLFAQSITSVASSRTFPSPANDIPEQPCGHPLAVVSVTLTLLRCVPGMDNNGNPPDVRTLISTARIIEEDRQVLRRSVAQHLKTLRNSYKIVNYTVGAANSVGPEGQCGGIELMYSFGINNDAMVC